MVSLSWLPLLNWQNPLTDLDKATSFQDTRLFKTQPLAKDLKGSLSTKKYYVIFLKHLNEVQRKCSRYPCKITRPFPNRSFNWEGRHFKDMQTCPPDIKCAVYLTYPLISTSKHLKKWMYTGRIKPLARNFCLWLNYMFKNLFFIFKQHLKESTWICVFCTAVMYVLSSS